MYLSYGYSNKSREILEEAVKDYNNYDIRYHELQLHTTYKCLSETSKALYIAKKMVTDYNHWYGGYQSLGGDYLSVGDYLNAKKYLETALKLNDKDPVTYLLLTAVSYELKEDEQALDYYEKACELDPLQTYFDWRSSAAAVGIYVFRGQFKKAKDILDQQQELFPEIKKDKRFDAVKDFYENALKKSSKQ